MIRILLPAIAALFLSACTQTNGQLALNAKAQEAVVKLCAQDAALQPVAAATIATGATVIGTAVPQATPGSAVVNAGIALDNSTLHPLVQDACAKIAAQPVAVAATPAK